MDTPVETKICPLCAETINSAAKVCPHCRTWLTKWSILNPKIQGTILCIIYCCICIGMGFFVEKLFGPKHDFAEFRDQIKIVSSSMEANPSGTNSYVTVVGVLTNYSNITWRRIQIESQYFDRDGKLIDTGRNDESESEILPHDEHAFRIRTKADKIPSRYSSFKVFVRSARDAKELF